MSFGGLLTFCEVFKLVEKLVVKSLKDFYKTTFSLLTYYNSSMIFRFVELLIYALFKQTSKWTFYFLSS